MLVLLLGAGQGLQNGVTSSMILDATNSIWFFADRTTLPYKGMSPGRQIKFTEEDLAMIEEQVEGFEFMSPENDLRGNFQVAFQGNAGNFQVLGTDRDYFQIKIYQEYLAGRKLNLNDNMEARKVCVIGDRVSEVLFTRGEDPIGQYILIKDVAFKVVGLFHDEGWGGRFSERVYLPFSSFQRSFNPDKSVTLFAVTTREGVSGKALEKEIMTLLAQKHLVHPDDNQAFWSHNQEDQYKSVTNLFLGDKVLCMVGGNGNVACRHCWGQQYHDHCCERTHKGDRYSKSSRSYALVHYQHDPVGGDCDHLRCRISRIIHGSAYAGRTELFYANGRCGH